jgi:hypothetical protein
MRPRLDSEMLVFRAMVLRDQCLELPGLLCVVFSIICVTSL